MAHLGAEAPVGESELSRDFSVYLWDMPGYGRSSKPPEHDVDLATQGELFTDLLASGISARRT